MGYRINVNNVNAIGHLIEGNVISYIEQINSSENNLQGTIEYFNDLFERNTVDLISYNKIVNSQLTELKIQWPEIQRLLRKENILNNVAILNYFNSISKILNKYKYKFLLLPGFKVTTLNRHLTSIDNLHKWLSSSSTNSALIIQLKDLPGFENIEIINSFNHYKLALDRVDEWPAILVWENYFSRSRGLFIPLKSIEEVDDIFLKLRYEKDFFNLLLSRYGERTDNDLIELIHLSDLHLGVRNQSNKVSRLLKILEIQYASKVSEKITIISGDLVDHPNEENLNKYNEFEQSLQRIGYSKIVKVPGNHDYIWHGFISQARAITNTVMGLINGNAVEIFEEYKLIIIKFNSNIIGKLAQGQIGESQMVRIGNELDSIMNLEQYCLIAVLHHHLFELNKPEWMHNTFVERVLGNRLMKKTLCLQDSPLFIEWLKNRKIHFIIHGHNHIPMLAKKENLNIISAGSSTGFITHNEEGKTFITYNIIKYNKIAKSPCSSTIIFEEILGSGIKHYQIMKYM
jgi:predicted phosphodiesterase